MYINIYISILDWPRISDLCLEYQVFVFRISEIYASNIGYLGLNIRSLPYLRLRTPIFNTRFRRKTQQKSMQFTIHKWVLSAIAVPKPTQFTKLDKYTAKNPNRNWSAIGVYIQFRGIYNIYICLYICPSICIMYIAISH